MEILEENEENMASLFGYINLNQTGKTNVQKEKLAVS
jgi:hypothetical protein